MTYYANFKANHGTRWQRDCQFTSKQAAIRAAKHAAEAERFEGNESEWYVYTREDDYSSCICIASGTIDRNGKSHNTPKSLLGYIL